ncbi:MAG: permease [Acidobacteria bacterium]|nr:permease [Acidobacteriota bacterium]
MSTVVEVVYSPLIIFRLRERSLVRGIALSLIAFITSLLLAGFPHIENLHGSPWQVLALILGAWGMVETGRCMRKKWSLYSAGVLILLYSDLVILMLIVFLVAYR